MFDIGFMELLVCLLVGLFVIGPERLPTTLRTIALWVGRIKRSLLETRREIEQQLGADEIRRELHNEQVMREWEKMQELRKDLEGKLNGWDKEPLQNEIAPTPSPEVEAVHAVHAVHASKTAAAPAPASDAPAPVVTPDSPPASPPPQPDEPQK